MRNNNMQYTVSITKGVYVPVVVVEVDYLEIDLLSRTIYAPSFRTPWESRISFLEFPLM